MKSAKIKIRHHIHSFESYANEIALFQSNISLFRITTMSYFSKLLCVLESYAQPLFLQYSSAIETHYPRVSLNMNIFVLNLRILQDTTRQ